MTPMDPRTHNQSSSGAKAGDHPPPSRSELLSSAKLVGEAARAKVSHEQSKTDKAELSAAAADLLNAASHYGKLEEKAIGKYVEKAENYLHKYSTSHSPTAASDHHSASPEQGHSSGHSGGGYGEYIKMAEGVFKKHSAQDSTTTAAPDHHSTTAGGAHSSGHSGGGGGYGEYIKMAESVFNKHTSQDSTTTSHSQNKYGEYAKMAGDFLKKH